MPSWGDSQRYSVDYSNEIWGSDIDFLVLQTKQVWIRSPWEGHRFVFRGNLGWIETNNFDKVPPDLRFFAGVMAVYVVTVTKKSLQRIVKAS